MSDQEKSAKGPLLVNRGKAVFHIRPTVKLDKEGKPEGEVGQARDINPGEAFHADDEKQAESLLNYHAIGEGSEDDPRIATEIEQLEEKIKVLKEEQSAQKKPVEKLSDEAENAKKETSADREKRKRHHRHR